MLQRERERELVFVCIRRRWVKLQQKHGGGSKY